MVKFNRVVLFLVFLLLGCSSTPVAPVHSGEPRSRASSAESGDAARLPAGGWAPANHRALEAWLESVANRDWETAPVAVFDWDNTCIYNDIGEATFRYQLDRLAIRLTPDELAEHLPEELDGHRELDSGVSLGDLRADILDAYRQLHPLIVGGDIDAARALPAHRDFRAKAAFLYESLYGSEYIPHTHALVWLVGWLAGYRTEEVNGIVEATLEQVRAEPNDRITWVSASAGRAGNQEHAFRTGLCPHPEMQALMQALEGAGVRVFVVSASAELVVEAAARALDYPIGPEAIFGVRVVIDDGVITTRALPGGDYPVTYRAGKVDVIRSLIGADPIFVAGDADTDYEMLTEFPGIELRLIINRNKLDDEIGALYFEALRGQASEGPQTLLQGRDEARCSFQPLHETTALGEREPRAIALDSER